MTGTSVLIIPVRSFDGMSRLARSMAPSERSRLARRLAIATVDASLAAVTEVIVVTADDAVGTTLEQRGATIVDDPGGGLDAAADAGRAAAGGGTWIVVHADLPLITASAVAAVADLVERGATVLVPSLDGGTNVVGGRGPFTFSFGPGSFHRHLAAHTDATVVVDPRLMVDLDTPLQFAALGRRIPTA